MYSMRHYKEQDSASNDGSRGPKGNPAYLEVALTVICVNLGKAYSPKILSSISTPCYNEDKQAEEKS